MIDFGSIKFLPAADVLGSLLIHLFLNVAFTIVVVRLVYARLYAHRDYVFTYVLLNTVTFTLGFLMSSVHVELGLGIGLFGVFGILRYRTEAIPVRELTYLLIVIGVGLLNGLARTEISLLELLILNGVIVGAVVLLERLSFSGREHSRRVVYDRLDLLSPASAAQLLEDLRGRTHLPIQRYEIGNVDLLRDTVDIAVYYPASER
jgi:hypothetical protein